MITLTTYSWVPPFAQGLVRDMRVRWALEEAGLPYRTRLIDLEQRDSPEHLVRQPFAQVPAYEDESVNLFESGAIVLHIGARSETLLPTDPAERTRAITWLFAAINTLEPAIQPLAELDLFHADEDWARQRRPEAEKAVRKRLDQLAAWLGEQDYLENRFTLGDLMTVCVLQILRGTALVEEQPRLAAYRARCEARPAYRRALSDHMAVFEESESQAAGVA
ncbi:glutathione S-transferase family protein [Fodinicurvata sediminis]|uniref:glutathione S-transferase family protein n=1 Tax=Fodinicurvata sediminis TaxID=1121832 RepID=UPI0003B74E2B|nr:glutathione S-transferase family protein [Fodinicurvata sediminis]